MANVVPPPPSCPPLSLIPKTPDVCVSQSLYCRCCILSEKYLSLLIKFTLHIKKCVRNGKPFLPLRQRERAKPLTHFSWCREEAAWGIVCAAHFLGLESQPWVPILSQVVPALVPLCCPSMLDSQRPPGGRTALDVSIRVGVGVRVNGFQLQTHGT